MLAPSVNNKNAPLCAERQSSPHTKTAEFLELVHHAEGVIQVFIKHPEESGLQNLVGYYDSQNLEKLAQDVQPYSGTATGIFYGINPVSPSCLSLANNCLRPGNQARAAKNADILCRRLMLIDIDPVRASDCSATKDEKAVAYCLARVLYRDLRRAGWPKPLVVDSGNGFHLLCRVELPADDDRLIRNCIRALADRYDCEGAKIDTSVHDARRLAKLPGTMTCKGVHSSERPHRYSSVHTTPAKFSVVPEKLLHELASHAPPRPQELVNQDLAPSHVGSEAEQIKNARSYLKKIDSAISGQNGRNQFLNAACRLVDDFALSATEAQPLLEEYNQRCVPPFDARGIADKLSSAVAKVAQRGGPSGVAIKHRTKARPETVPKFVGYVPDFGLVDQNWGLLPITSKHFDGFGVWYFLLWRFLRSNTLIPDVMLRQWYYGANYDRNWKSRLKSKVKFTRAVKSKCSRDTCMLFGTGVKHDHYHWELKSYGAIDQFCSPGQREAGQPRIFDVYGADYAERRKELQKVGHLFNVYWPALVLGSSRKVGWSWSQQRLVLGMVRELTRRRARAGEDIAGEVITGGLVTASKDITQKKCCPQLDAAQEYVAFAGNGNRKGRGYQLVGRTGKGWIYRAGYLDAPQMNAERRLDAVKSFLGDLESLSKDLGLIPAAVNQGTWKSLDELIDCTRTGHGQDWLECCTMRIYAPADWRLKWRQFFSTKMGFEWIPASPEDTCNDSDHEPKNDPDQITSAHQLKKWLKQIGWTQQRLADEIAGTTGSKCSVRRVQRYLACTSQGGSFFQEVDLVRQMQQKATPDVTATESL